MPKHGFFAVISFALSVAVLLVMFFFLRYGLWDELKNVNPEEAKKNFTNYALSIVSVLLLIGFIFTFLYVKESKSKNNHLQP